MLGLRGDPTRPIFSCLFQGLILGLDSLNTDRFLCAKGKIGASEVRFLESTIFFSHHFQTLVRRISESLRLRLHLSRHPISKRSPHVSCISVSNQHLDKGRIIWLTRCLPKLSYTYTSATVLPIKAATKLFTDQIAKTLSATRVKYHQFVTNALLRIMYEDSRDCEGAPKRHVMSSVTSYATRH